MSNTILASLKDVHISPFNMRAEKRPPSLKRMAEIAANILPSVREKGVLTPVIARQNSAGLEILAGRRRFYAACVVADETGQDFPLRCELRENCSDAEALEISAIENMAREDADELTNFDTFAGLIRLGRTPAEIAATFVKMSELLGPLHHESYVYVDEVRGDAYGYGGVTQNERYIAGKLKQAGKAAA